MKLINPNFISAEIITLLEEAEERVIIVSPYCRFQKWYKLKDRLYSLVNRGIATEFYIRKGESDDESGGDYWITSTSCIYQVIKQDNIDLIDDKILDLSDRMQATDNKRSKLMHQRNIDILTSFKDFNYRELLPPKDFKIEKITGGKTTIMIKQFPIVVKPQIVFSFERKGKKEVGAIWLMPQINGFKRPELGMFCEMLYRFLNENFAEHFQISTDYCIAVDTYNGQKITYSDLLSGDISHLVETTVDEINNF